MPIRILTSNNRIIIKENFAGSELAKSVFEADDAAAAVGKESLPCSHLLLCFLPWRGWLLLSPARLSSTKLLSGTSLPGRKLSAAILSRRVLPGGRRRRLSPKLEKAGSSGRRRRRVSNSCHYQRFSLKSIKVNIIQLSLRFLF